MLAAGLLSFLTLITIVSWWSIHYGLRPETKLDGSDVTSLLLSLLVSANSTLFIVSSIIQLIRVGHV